MRRRRQTSSVRKQGLERKRPETVAQRSKRLVGKLIYRIPLPLQAARDSYLLIFGQLFLLLLLLGLGYYTYHYPELTHDHVSGLYAHLGSVTAKERLAERLLQGQLQHQFHRDKALDYLHESAAQGDPHSAYNLALARFKGLDQRLDRHRMDHYIKLAKEAGIHDAFHLYNACNNGRCNHIL
ncbi:hypothetical protein Ciccas_013618 [Cichlidogyrus casuarinus]|uniref:Sel1 repeat family protein n=1 Tax=Cichlidogyrus casuarinus TaxID=1844966 RepID=A0ABD2PK66_9PLAT